MGMEKHFLNRIERIVGTGNFMTLEHEMEPYAHDEIALEKYNQIPIAVVKPTTEQQVAEVVTACAEHRIPVTARGGGTGLSGGCIPSENGIVLSLERLNRILEVDKANQCIAAEAGVTLTQLYHAVESEGLFFPPHPGDEGAMVGGIVAANAGGARAVKYGTVKRFVRGLRVVTAGGSILELGGKLLKSSTGYHLLDLMIGSEGTLGIITQATFSLLPPPGAIETLVVPFPSVDQAIEAVPVIMATGIIPFAVEFIEHSVLRYVENLLQKSWPAKVGEASLLIILDGPDQDQVLTTAERIAEELENSGALDILIAEGKQKQADILELRSMIYEALRPGTVELFDICVPPSEVVAHVRFVHQLEQKYGVILPTFGHAADGNVHTHSMRCRLDDGRIGWEIENWETIHEAVREEIYNDVISRGGVVSGEHGIGLSKKTFLDRNIDPNVVAMMKAIKRTLDPDNILNPGKLFSEL